MGDVAFCVTWKCDDCGMSDVHIGWTKSGEVTIKFRCHCNPITVQDEEF